MCFSLYCLCPFADELLKVLNRFYKKKEMQKLAADHGLDGEDGSKTFICSSSITIPSDQKHFILPIILDMYIK